MIEFRSGGRRVTAKQFTDGLKDQVMANAMKAVEDRIHAAASSLVDPDTDKHAEVIVRQIGGDRLSLQTSGSQAFARELERRLQLSVGEVQSVADSVPNTPRVYLAHASEDHETLARPLSEKLMAAGVDVWLDAWEIKTGDSLRQKMEEGLSDSSHFLVLLTPNSIGKAWVEREIDVGFVRAVSGKSRFMGLRVGVAISDLSEFLQTVRCPSVNLGDDSQVADIISDIYGATRKPALGEAPRYVKSAPEGLTGWSKAAIGVAEHLVTASTHGLRFDPQTDTEQVSAATGIPKDDVALGVLDLQDAGLIDRSRSLSSDRFWPKPDLFVEFDRHFLPFDNRVDGKSVANRLVEFEAKQVDIEKLAEAFSDWESRRLNSALHYLEAVKAIEAFRHFGTGKWAMGAVHITDRTRKFVRDHG